MAYIWQDSHERPDPSFSFFSAKNFAFSGKAKTTSLFHDALLSFFIAQVGLPFEIHGFLDG